METVDIPTFSGTAVHTGQTGASAPQGTPSFSGTADDVDQNGMSTLQGSPRLSLQDKVSILTLLDNGDCRSYEEAGRLFGVSQQAVSYIVSKRDDYFRIWNTLAAGFATEGTSARGANDERPRRAQVKPHYVGAMDIECEFCGALHYPGEASRYEDVDGERLLTFQSCCAHGKWKEDQPDYPSELKAILIGEHPKSEHFQERIRNINSANAFGSVNAETYDFPTNGPWVYRVHGAVVSKFSTAARPDPPERPRYGQLYIINSEEALALRAAEPANDGVDEELLRDVDRIMRQVNPYAHAYNSMREVEEQYRAEAERECQQRGLPLSEAEVPEVRLLFNLKQKANKSYEVPVVSEVAAIFVCHGNGEMPDAHLVVDPRGGSVRNLSTLSPDLIPMCFPLFYPYGTRGWAPRTPYTRQTGKRGYVTRLQFYSSRLNVRRGVFNPLFFGGRLLQEFIVTLFMHVEADRMQWIRENQKAIRAQEYTTVHNRLREMCNEGGLTVDSTFILPSSYPGSPRCQQRLYEDAMCIVQRFGKPQLFITMTANPKWREMIEACTYYVDEPDENTNLSTVPPRRRKVVQRSTNRPDIQARVFDLKKKALVKKVRAGFFGRTVADVHVIESQKRGNLHMHLLVTLHPDDAPKSTADIDRMVQAVIPCPTDDPELFELVKQHHIHGPCDVGKSVCQDSEGRCTKKFPKGFRKESSLGEDGYAQPARPDDGPTIEYANGKVAHNGFVVPYNAELLQEFQCHINVELCGGIRFVKYLYKYCYKQLASAHMEITAAKTLVYDEIKKFLDVRYMAAPEAMWRLLEKPMQVKSHAVLCLHVHLRAERIRDLEPDEPGISVDEEGRFIPEKSMLFAYFRLNQNDPRARLLHYYELPEHYTWKASDGEWEPRRNSSKTIGRLCNVDVRCSERFHLRLLLLHVKGATCYEDLKMVNGHEHASFAEACVALGLARDDSEWDGCLQDASLWKMPMQLRKLFAMILALNSPKDPLRLWSTFRDVLSEDYVRRHQCTQEQAYVAALLDIADELRTYGKALRDFPTLPQNVNVEYSDEAIDVPREALTGREMYVTLTDEQKRFVDRVMTKLRIFFCGTAAANHRGRMPLTGDCLFLNGPGGSGKSYTYRVLFHLIRGAGFKVLMMASTGAAATLLPQGTTAHHAAALPVPLRSNSKANPRGLKLRKFSEAHVIIWDEAPMSVRYAFEAFDERLREIHQTTAPFGGTIVVLGGDFRQCLPVEEHSLTSEQLNLSVKRSRLWANFTVFDLTTNLRLQPGLEWFAEWQLSVGEGRNLGGPEGQESLPAEIISNGDLISEVYGEVLNAANVPAQRTLAEYLGSRCILAVLNEVCTWYNNAIVERLPGPAKVYASTDEIIADSSTDSHRHPVEFLHTIDVAGLPPHKLRVKRNTVVMLLRNLQVTEGLCNGTRMLVLDAKPNVLLVRILNGSHAGRIREIPRITLIYEGRHFPFKFTRHQFPVRLAFAMTVNKSQGQTFDFVGADLRHEVFSHGQLYVVASRVRSSKGLRILCGGQNSTRNIVCKEIL